MPEIDHAVLTHVADAASRAGVFERVEVDRGMVVCTASGSAEPAFYRVGAGEAGIFVELVTPDRWLSGSIEGDLVHTGDALEELVDEELADLGYAGPATSFEHYRSEDKLFTFRSPVPEPGDGATPEETAARMLLAYERVFRELGDMSEPAE